MFLEVAASFLRAAREQESDDKDREANPNLPFQRLGSLAQCDFDEVVFEDHLPRYLSQDPGAHIHDPTTAAHENRDKRCPYDHDRDAQSETEEHE